MNETTDNKTDHTPGPFELSHPRQSPNGDGWIRTIRSKDPQTPGFVIATVRAAHSSCTGSKEGAQEELANARLLAAAPEMLEALKEVLPVLEGLAKERHVMVGEARRGEHRDKLLAAIAKAEGGAS